MTDAALLAAASELLPKAYLKTLDLLQRYLHRCAPSSDMTDRALTDEQLEFARNCASLHSHIELLTIYEKRRLIELAFAQITADEYKISVVIE